MNSVAVAATSTQIGTVTVSFAALGGSTANNDTFVVDEDSGPYDLDVLANDIGDEEGDDFTIPHFIPMNIFNSNFTTIIPPAILGDMGVNIDSRMIVIVD